MKRMIRKWLLCALLAAVPLVLCGCLSATAMDDFFALPQPPIEYTDLSETIHGLLASGYEYASPSAGQNIQAVQIVDLDWDGRSEAVAFFRNPSDEKPLKIMIFRSLDGAYEPVVTIESSGTAIERVEYQDMNADGKRELVVGWKIGPNVQTVAVYAVGYEQTVLMQSNYTRYAIQEMDGDGVPSLMVLRADAEGTSVAEFYGWRSEGMNLVYRCALSTTMAALSRGSVVSGKLDEKTPAVFVTGVNEEGLAVTDILACRENGTLTNAAISPVTGLSAVIYPYRQLQPQDMDGDGCLEVPAPAGIPEAGKPLDGIVNWMRCDIDGGISRVMTTYHCQSAGWYFQVPEAWVGRLITRPNDMVLNESQVALQVDGKTVAAVYTIIGENRESRAIRGERTVLRRRTDVVYAGEVMDNEVGFDAEQLRSCFRLIVSSWNG